MVVTRALASSVATAVRRLDRALPGVDGITILAYHRVGTASSVSVDLEPSAVADQLDYLAAHTEVITLDAAVDAVLAMSTPAPSRPRVVLTADDGTADWVETLLPLLVQRGLPMTWYVATDFVERRREFPNGGRPVSWVGLADAASTGLIDVGSHTHTHAVMARLDRTRAADELDRSQGLIESRLQRACRHFAYPKAIAGSTEADGEVRRRFVSAALAANRVNVIGRTDPARLGRTPIQRRDTLADFAAKVAGRARLEGWLRERYDQLRHHDAVT